MDALTLSIAANFTLDLLHRFWIRTETVDRLPRWFEWLLNIPPHHRVHRSSNPRYLDANYAGVLMSWDRPADLGATGA